jgi:hypothetical protein
MRIAAGLLTLGVAGLALWHARPVLVWHLTAAPEIERMGRSHRLRIATDAALPTPERSWPRLRVGRIDLRAPLGAGQSERCRACADGCRLELAQGSGWLALFDSDLPPYAQALATFAPSADDVSIWRSRVDNWRTVHSLAARATGSTPPLEAFRFEAGSSRGIVSRVVSRGSERFVIYAFALDGSPGGVLAVSRAGLAVLRRMLGGLAVGDTVVAPRCEAGERA